MCVGSERPIKTGEEIFTYYGYKKIPPPDDFPWYFELKNRIEEEEAEERKKMDERSEKKMKKKKKKKSKSKKSTKN